MYYKQLIAMNFVLLNNKLLETVLTTVAIPTIIDPVFNGTNPKQQVSTCGKSIFLN